MKKQQTINNNTILHTGNHNNMFNPHSQYVLKSEYEKAIEYLNKNRYNLIMPLGKDYSNKYIEILTIKSKCSTETYNKILTYDLKMVMDGNLTDYYNLCEIYIKIDNIKDKSFCKTYFLNGDFSVNNFKQIFYEEDGYLVYKLYYLMNRNWSSIQCKEEFCFDTSKVFNIKYSGTILDELPIVENYEYKNITKKIN